MSMKVVLEKKNNTKIKYTNLIFFYSLTSVVKLFFIKRVSLTTC